jgi:putative transposon-encoded protein
MDIHSKLIEIGKKGLKIGEKVLDYYTAEVTPSGNSARINCQKKFLGKKVLVVVLDDEEGKEKGSKIKNEK